MVSERLVLWHRWLPPRQEEPSTHPVLAAWQRSVATRFSVAGGAPMGAIGGTVVASFDPADLGDAIEMALGLLEEAAAEGLESAIGVAIGDVTETDGVVIGGVIERAQLLANRARAGDLVLDVGARALAATEYLFGRNVGAGTGASRGSTIDRVHPRRDECAAAIEKLSPAPLPPVVDSVRRQIDDALSDETARTFILRGPVGAGASELIASLERARAPARVLRVGAAPGGVVPLASLRLSLQRRLGGPEQVAEAFGSEAGPVLARVTAGELVPREELARALAGVTSRSSGGRCWVVLSPLGLVDGATLAALLEARAMGADFVLFGRFPVETPLPRPLAELDEEVRELTLPPLKIADARVVAEAILGPATAEDVARRVAVLGGDTVLGVVEAARTLIATGELVREGEAFVWRLAARKGANAIGTGELLGERLDLLDVNSRRVLEALSVIPDGSPRSLLASVATRDGSGEHTFTRSVEVLAREALLVGRDHPRPASSLLRWQMLSLVPPARIMELHRFVAAVLLEAAPAQAPLLAEVGYFLREGGLAGEAAPYLARTMEALVTHGYERAARQISGWLAQAAEERHEGPGGRPTPPPPRFGEEPPPSTEIAIEELLDAPEGDTEPPPPGPARLPETRPGHLMTAAARTDGEAEIAPPRALASDAVRAIQAGDFASLENAMQRAIADGGDLGAVSRVRAVAELARGDLDAARKSLRDARGKGRDDGASQARFHLAEALLELRDGDPMMGIRAALAALATSRRSKDERGESASLHTLAACYRALGRDEQARRLET